MSQGDNLIGIPTTYKGIDMRSKLETKVAMFLDALKIKWQYEPKLFQLSNGIPYKPDFYLPELKMWIEVKGLIEPHNKEISRCFVKDNGTELMLVSSQEHLWYSMKDWVDEEGKSLCEDSDIQLGKCSNCESYFFCSNLGDYFCRKCNQHNGDHDIIGMFKNILNGEDIDFSDVNSIKRWLSGNRINI